MIVGDQMAVMASTSPAEKYSCVIGFPSLSFLYEYGSPKSSQYTILSPAGFTFHWTSSCSTLPSLSFDSMHWRHVVSSTGMNIASVNEKDGASSPHAASIFLLSSTPLKTPIHGSSAVGAWLWWTMFSSQQSTTPSMSPALKAACAFLAIATALFSPMNALADPSLRDRVRVRVPVRA